MDDSTSPPTYSIEFDDQARIRIKDLKLAQLILDHAEMHDGFEFQLDVDPAMLTTTSGKPPVPLSNLATGCTNICPMTVRIRLSRRLAQREKDFGRTGDSTSTQPTGGTG